MTVTTAIEASRELVLDALRGTDRFVLVTHENPDGDALGSLVGMHGILRALGKEAVMLVGAGEFPLPAEYRCFVPDDVLTEPPADLEDRTLLFLDCGNIDRNPAMVEHAGTTIVNVDHHHDNTRFGTVNHVDAEASCTAEIVWDLMRALGVEPTPVVADALYVGLVTDTGRFMYQNTGARAHVMAAELIAAGVDVHAVYRRLYEELPEAKLALLARGLEQIERFDDGRLTITQLWRSDFEAVGARQSHSEGVIDHLRCVQGTKVAAVARELEGGQGRRKVSLRATDGDVDVSVIARAGGGGGHRQAAGFNTTLGGTELVAFLREQLGAQR